jgi:D-glycero-alpha-D-manno-heptose 1-phosphate guanylyltransferase
VARNSAQALILAGGLGTRLRGVFDGGPKCLAPVAGRPFLEYLVRRLAAQGIRDIVLCVGHQQEQITKHFADGSSFGVTISYSVEDKLLGTAGALRNAAGNVRADDVLVLNGDSFFEMDYADLLTSHTRRKARITIAVLETQGSRYGSVEFDSELSITGFREKERVGIRDGEKQHFMNAGVYAISREVLDEIPGDRAVSIENELFPAQIGRRFFAHPASGYFIDIGVPADYQRAQTEFVQRMYA